MAQGIRDCVLQILARGEEEEEGETEREVGEGIEGWRGRRKVKRRAGEKGRGRVWVDSDDDSVGRIYIEQNRKEKEMKIKDKIRNMMMADEWKDKLEEYQDRASEITRPTEKKGYNVSFDPRIEENNEPEIIEPLGEEFFQRRSRPCSNSPSRSPSVNNSKRVPSEQIYKQKKLIGPDNSDINVNFSYSLE